MSQEDKQNGPNLSLDNIEASGLPESSVSDVDDAWKAGRAEKLAIACLSIVSLVVALDATILVPVLPVGLFLYPPDPLLNFLLDPGDLVEWLRDRDLLGRNVVSPRQRDLSTIHRGVVRRLWQEVAASYFHLLVCGGNTRRRSFPRLRSISGWPDHPGNWRRRHHHLGVGDLHGHYPPPPTAQIHQLPADLLGGGDGQWPASWSRFCRICIVALDVWRARFSLMHVVI